MTASGIRPSAELFQVLARRGLAHFSARFALFAGDGAIAEKCACPLPAERQLFQVLNMDSAREVPPRCGKITLDPSVDDTCGGCRDNGDIFHRSSAQERNISMGTGVKRRDFVQLAVGGTLLCLHGRLPRLRASDEPPRTLISPGCRGSKVKVARLYLGVPRAHYPNPAIDPASEKRMYAEQFARMKDELADVEFAVDELITAPEQVDALADRIAACDGVLAVHMTLHTMPMISKVLAIGRPTMIFSAPYAGHEWHELSDLRRQKLGENMDCVLTADYRQLATAIRPFRAIASSARGEGVESRVDSIARVRGPGQREVRHDDYAGPSATDAQSIPRGQRSGGP